MGGRTEEVRRKEGGRKEDTRRKEEGKRSKEEIDTRLFLVKGEGWMGCFPTAGRAAPRDFPRAKPEVNP